MSDDWVVLSQLECGRCTRQGNRKAEY